MAKTSDIYFFPSSGSQKSEFKVSTRLVPSGGSERKLSYASLLASSGCLQSLVFPWLVAESFQSLPASPYGLLPCVSSHGLLTRTPASGVRANPNHYDLILTNYICKNSSTKQGHVLKFWVDMNLWGRHYLTQHKGTIIYKGIYGQMGETQGIAQCPGAIKAERCNHF